MYPEYEKIKVFIEQAKLLDNTDKDLKSIYKLSILRNRKALACQYYNEDGKLKKYKYSQFDKNVRTIAYNLSRFTKNKEHHKPIVLKMVNNPHWGEVFWAIAISGFTPLLIDARTGHNGTINLINQSGAVGIVSDDLYEYEVDKFNIEELLDFNGLKDIETADWDNNLILCSSGTTGDVKLMVFNGQNFVSQIQASLKMPEETKDLMYPNKCGDLKILAMIPFHHIFGFVAVFLWFTYYGKTIVYPQSLAPSDVLSVCQKVGITHVFSVPLFWDSMAQTLSRKAEMAEPKKAELLKNLIAYNNKEISKEQAGKASSGIVRSFVQKSILGNKVRYCISGGGYLNESTARIINGVGYPLYNGYGMTEIGVTSVNLRSDVEERLRGDIGHPLYGIEYKILPTNPEIPNRGELFVKSNIIHSKEIIGGVERVTPLDEEGFFATGDIAECDESGNYYIKGRIKDVIINADGENIFPDELELFFKGVSDVSNLTIFGLREGNSSNEKIILVIELSMTCTDERYEEIKKEIKEIATQLPKNGKIDEFYLSKNKLPIANSMKVKRFEVKKAIKNKDPNYISIDEKAEKKPIVGFTEEEILTVREPLREIFSQVLVLPKFKIEDDAHWINDLGGDSMSYVELLQKSEGHFGVKLDENLYGKLATLNEFTEAFLNVLKKK